MPLELAIFEDWVFSKCVNYLIFWVSQVDYPAVRYNTIGLEKLVEGKVGCDRAGGV